MERTLGITSCFKSERSETSPSEQTWSPFRLATPATDGSSARKASPASNGAFLPAGAKSVLAGLRPADDIFTTALMKRFYQHLAEGQDKGTALRQAKLDLLEKFGDSAVPYHRAGFVLVGDGATWNVA